MDNNRRRLYSLLIDFYCGKLSEDYFEDVTYRKIYRKIYFQTFRHLLFIEKAISKYLKKDTPVELYAALILGAVQILFMDDIPHYAAVNETLNLLKPKQRGFVNAVLRKVISDKDIILKDYNVLEDFPEWIVNRVRKNFGEESVETVLQAYNTPPQNFYLDLNVFKFLPYDEFSKVPSDALAIDKASAYIPLLSKGCNAHKILDACAAPGGKTVILSKLHGNSHINAFEKDKKRAEKLNKNIQKYGCQNVKVFNEDVLGFEHTDKYDLILLDAPCSSLGTIRRHPEVKFFRNPKLLQKNASNQYKFLTKLSNLLNDKGIIIYSVCSLEQEEGVDIVKSFLKENSDFELVKIDEPEAFLKDGFFYSLIHKTGCDGFFGAVLRKV